MITRRNPIRDMMAMQNAIERMFDDEWRPLYDRENTLALDIDESNDAYTVTTSIPGVKPEDININIHDNVLTIEAEVRSADEETEENGKRVLMRERRYGKFTRSVRLAQPVDVDNVDANYEDGVLTLSVPKAEEAQPRRIEVHTR